MCYPWVSSIVMQELDDKDRLMRKILAENEKLKAELAARGSWRPASAPHTPLTPRTPTSVASASRTLPSPASVVASSRPTPDSRKSVQTKSEPADDESVVKQKLRDMDEETLLDLYDLSHKDYILCHA